MRRVSSNYGKAIIKIGGRSSYGRYQDQDELLLLANLSRKLRNLRKVRKLRPRFYASPVTVVEGLGDYIEPPWYTALLRPGSGGE